MKKTSYPIDWTYNRKTDVNTGSTQTQNFEAAVSFQFVKVQESDLEGADNSQKTSRALLSFSDDLFYAFGSKSGASVNSIISLSAAAVLALSTVF